MHGGGFPEKKSHYAQWWTIFLGSVGIWKLWVTSSDFTMTALIYIKGLFSKTARRSYIKYASHSSFNCLLNWKYQSLSSGNYSVQQCSQEKFKDDLNIMNSRKSKQIQIYTDHPTYGPLPSSLIFKFIRINFSSRPIYLQSRHENPSTRLSNPSQSTTVGGYTPLLTFTQREWASLGRVPKIGKTRRWCGETFAKQDTTFPCSVRKANFSFVLFN